MSGKWQMHVHPIGDRYGVRLVLTDMDFVGHPTGPTRVEVVRKDPPFDTIEEARGWGLAHIADWEDSAAIPPMSDAPLEVFDLDAEDIELGRTLRRGQLNGTTLEGA